MILTLTLAAALGVTSLDGQPVDPFDVSADGMRVRALVFAFVDPGCPVSNRYVPELNRLYAEYKQRGVKMWVIYSGADGLERIRAHYASYGLLVPALLDPLATLADRTGATTTAEAAVYDARGDLLHPSNWELVYRGRIDDRAPRVGVWRAVPTVRDLADVLRRLADGEVLTPRTTQAIGCYIKPSSLRSR